MNKFLFVLIIIFHFLLNAENIKFKHLTINDGLSQSTINHIFQDSRGYMWFATQDGLNKYDGYKFSIYRPISNDAFSINAIDILSIKEDTINYPNSLWIGTHQGGLNRLDLKSEKFSAITIKDGLSLNRIDDVNIDRNGVFWLATAGGGLNKLDFNLSDNSIKNPKVSVYTTETSSIADNYIWTVEQDPIFPDSILWIGTYNGLNRLNKLTGQVEKFYNNLNDRYFQINNIRSIKSIWINKSAYLLIGTCGLFLFDISNNSYINILPNNIITDEVYSILDAGNGYYWVASYNGLFKIKCLDKNRWRITGHFVHNPVNQSSLSNNHILSLYLDKSGVLWVGSHGNGLNLYDKQANKFVYYNSDPESKIQLIDNNIKSIHEDKYDNVLWIGSSSSGLIKYDYDKNNIKYYSLENALKYNRILTISQEKEGNLWLGGFVGGLQYFNPNTEKCIQYLHDPFDSTSLSNNNVNSTLVDKQQRLWAATYGGGLNLFNPKKNKFTRFQYDVNDSMSINNNMTRVIFQDSDGHIWVGSEGGLSRIVEADKKIKFKQINLGARFGEIHVFSICEVKSNGIKTLWIGTEGNGLIAYSPQKGSIKHFSTLHGLPNNVIYSILPDLKGNLWIASNLGLSRFSLSDSIFTNYTVEDGLQSNEFNLGAFCRKKDGELLFGGINGINAFYPDYINQNQFKSPVVLTDFRIFNEPVKIDATILNKSLYYTQAIHLPFSKNVFSLEFSSLHYFKSEKNQYAYTLQGFENKWNYVKSDRRYVTYTNLDPGNYIFKVKATNNDGVWNPEERKLTIVVHPPFWGTWWFRVLGICLIALILYLLHRYRIKRLLEIERLRVRIASDLHDDIGSALSRISVHSEIIQNSEDDNTVKNSSKHIGNMSRDIITTMSDIVWSIDARNDLMKNLIDRMKDFATSLLVEKDIQLIFKYEGLDLEKKLPIALRQNLFLIYKEAINNIYKHSKATKVNVTLINSANEFIMQINDNGKGYDTNMIQKGNGVKNMKMRAERVGATIDVKSVQGVEIKLVMNRI